MAHLSLTLFGPLHVALDGQPITRFQSNKVRALLAYLVMEADRRHHRDALATLLWPESPNRTARANLRRALSNLRRVIGDHDARPPFLTITRNSVQFNLASDSTIDVIAFEALAGMDQQGTSTTERLEEAVALYRGPFLEGFSLRDSAGFDDWVLLTGERLQRQALIALKRLTQQYERRGELDRACRTAQRQVEMEPWQEGARRELMRLLALNGQRTAALAQYEACQRALMDGLRVKPARETTELYERIRDEVELPSLSRGPQHNLPLPLLPLIGREEELAEIQSRIRNPACRLLTVIGPGGVGKSRLALQAAEDQIQGFPDGVYVVNLASIGSADLLASSIMQALGIPLYGEAHPGVHLVNALRDKRLLLLLDNFEHLLGATPLVTRVLGAALGLKVLVTSRVRLNLQEEWLLPLRGLTFPDQAQTTRETAADSATDRRSATSEQHQCALEDCAAVQLFMERARRVRPDFSLTTSEAAWVGRVCWLVEGMPLAIELAAPWVRTMPCSGIALEIEQSLDLLSSSLLGVPERHRSVRAVFDHSWSLLSAEEREVLPKLSVFRGGFHREAADAVAGDRGQSPVSLQLLSSLVDKSWLRTTPSGRYEVHELVRQYAGERLEVEHRVRDQHAEYYTMLLAEREGRLKGRGQAESLREILQDMDNVRAAWGWAVERGQVKAIKRCLVALWLIGETRCWYHEMQQVFGAAATRLREDVSSPTHVGSQLTKEKVILLAEVLSMQAHFSLRIAAFGEARMQCEESMDLLTTVQPGPRQDIACAESKVTLGWVLLGRGQTVQASGLFREALALARRAGDAWIEGRVFILLGYHAWQVGEYREAEKFLLEGIAASDREGERQSKAWKLHTMAGSLAAEGQYLKAEEAATESLQMHQQMGDKGGIANAVLYLGDVDAGLGRHEQAAQRYRESFALALEADGRFMQSWALTKQGWLSMKLARYVEARERFERVLAMARELDHQWRVTDALVGLGHATSALGDLEQSREYLLQALQKSIEPGFRPEALNALVGLAAVHAQEGRPDTASELLALVIQHPASSRMTRDRGRRLLSQLETEMPPEVFAAATAQGRERELEKVVAEALGAR